MEAQPSAQPQLPNVSQTPLPGPELPNGGIEAVPPHVQRVADALTRRGAGGADLALTNAQYLLDVMPEVRGLSDVPDATGISPFDRAITNKLNTVGHQINTQLANDVQGRVIDTADAWSKIDDLANKAAEHGDFATSNKVRKIADLIDNGLNGTPGEQLIEMRREIGKSSLDISDGVGHEVYQIFKDLSEQVSPGIKDLNQKWFTLKTATEIAEIRTGGMSPQSQVGAGIRPKASLKERAKAARETSKK